jgi:hypothetical protein
MRGLPLIVKEAGVADQTLLDYVKACTKDGLAAAGVEEPDLDHITDEMLESFLASEERGEVDDDKEDVSTEADGWTHYGYQLWWINPWLVAYLAACGTARYKWYGPPRVTRSGNCGNRPRYHLTHPTRGPVRW